MTSETNNDKLMTVQDDWPLLLHHNAFSVVARRDSHEVHRERFLSDVHALVRQLPDATYAINLCEDRYWFLVGFSAALVAGQTNLLPPNRSSGSITHIAQSYRGSYYLSDQICKGIDIPHHLINTGTHCDLNTAQTVPMIPGDHMAAIVFTSGSSGSAQPNPKYWKDLVTGSQMVQQRLGFGLTKHQHTIVATVPPQHMYGLETTILNPLVNGVSIYSGPAFFPADIRDALASVPEPRILVTTPFHLKTALDAKLTWPPLDYILSATAHLEQSLAARAEHIFDCPVLEIYGCSETGSLASRRTTRGPKWLLYDQSKLVKMPNGYGIRGPNLSKTTQLHDIIEPINDRQFILRGRHSDIVNIAGKRASLEDLNTRLRSIAGISDGVFIIPDSDDDSVTRLVALVVSPTLELSKIRKILAEHIDPVFLPKYIYNVTALPRNETGKLPRSALLELLEKTRKQP